MIAKDHLGKTYKSLVAMARAWGISYSTLISRLDLGWTVEDALTRPVGYRAGCLKPSRLKCTSWAIFMAST